MPASSGRPLRAKGWSARENTNGSTGKMHGLRMVSAPPRYARTMRSMVFPALKVSGTGSGSARREGHRDAVHAVAQAGGTGTVVEDVSEVAAAAPAVHFRARFAERAVFARGDRVIERRPEARPAGMAVEFRARREEVEPASRAAEHAGPMFVVERAAVGPFGALLAQHGVLCGSEQAAPFLVGMNHFETLGGLVRGRRSCGQRAPAGCHGKRRDRGAA